MTNEKKNENARLECDYLVIGAGTCGMSFIDTLLTEHESASVILADQNLRPGGHWTMAYPFVRLHQPSSNYGVNSLPLGKTRDSKGREREDANDRATAQEMLEYYDKVKDQFLDSGRVRCIFNAEYHQAENGDHILSLLNSTVEGKISDHNDNSSDKDKHCLSLENQVYTVKCRKVVRCISNVVVPSMRQGPNFLVDNSITVRSVNELPKEIDKNNTKRRYIVLGAGKTGSDAIVYMLENGVDQSSITWVVSRDMWYFIREGIWTKNGENTYKDKITILERCLKVSKSADLFLDYEQSGIVGRLQPNNSKIPDIFRGATVDREELNKLRSIENVIRLGRITSIDLESIIFEQGKVSLSSLGGAKDGLLIDCMAEGNGYEAISQTRLFERGRINIGPLLQIANPSFSAAIIAFLEATFNEECDDLKNQFCFYPHGEYAKLNMRGLLVNFYTDIKTTNAMKQYKPAANFMLTSRTNPDAPTHHGGLFKFLWAILGPTRLMKRSTMVMKRIENGGFDEAKNYFGYEQRIPEKIPRSVVRIKSKVRKYMKENGSSSISSYPPK